MYPRKLSVGTKSYSQESEKVVHDPVWRKVISTIGLIPNKGQVVFLPLKEAATTASGIILSTDSSEAKNRRIGRVVAIGSNTADNDTLRYSVGDLVAFTPMTALPIELPFDDTEYLLSPASALLGHWVGRQDLTE